jgi:hypothetical protein
MFGRAPARTGGMGSALKARLLIALVIAVIAVISYYGKPGGRGKPRSQPLRTARCADPDAPGGRVPR